MILSPDLKCFVPQFKGFLGQLMNRLIISSERQFRSISVWRLRFTYTWMCRNDLEPGRESRKASWGWYWCRNLKYEGGERVILYTGTSMQQKHGCNRKLNYVEKNHKEFWIVEQSKDKVVKFCFRQLMKDFSCMVKIRKRRVEKGDKFKSY